MNDHALLITAKIDHNLREIRAEILKRKTTGSDDLAELLQVGAQECSPLPQLVGYGALCDEFILLFAMLVVTLMHSREAPTRSPLVRAILLLVATTAESAIAVRALSDRGLGGPARNSCRTLIEQTETVFVLLQEPSLAEEFCNPNENSKANAFWFRHIAKGKSLKAKISYLRDALGPEYTEDSEIFWKEQASDFSLAAHPSAIASNFALLASNRSGDQPFWPNFLGGIDRASVRTLRVCTAAMVELFIGLEHATKNGLPLYPSGDEPSFEFDLAQLRLVAKKVVSIFFLVQDDDGFNQIPLPSWLVRDQGGA